jgi:hypothetical protein
VLVSINSNIYHTEQIILARRSSEDTGDTGEALSLTPCEGVGVMDSNSVSNSARGSINK